MIQDKHIHYGVPIVWRNAGGDYAITLASLAAAAGRMGEVGDLAVTSLAGGRIRSSPKYRVELQINMDVAPVASTVVELWWCPSPDGVLFTGGVDGTDAAYTGTAAGSVAQSKLQLIHIGSIILTPDADGTVQRGTFIFQPPTRFGVPVVINLSAQILEADEDSHRITFTPILEETA